MPRRYPLLGIEDAQPVKAERAFTTKAEQEIWDIGCPTKERVTVPAGISEFRRNLHNGKYPFTPDHSSPNSVPRLAWATEIQNLDYTLLIPELIEGLTDREKAMNTVALTAITDLLKHGPVERIIDSLPTFTIAAKKAMDFSKSLFFCPLVTV